MTNGDIIILNGTSSSGKTTLAKAVLAKLPDPSMRMSLDDMWGLLPEKILAQAEWWKVTNLKPFVAGFHRAIAGYSAAGVNVVVDHCCTSKTHIEECVNLFKDARVIFVEVMCSPEVMRKRERRRKDRQVGQGEAQIDGFEKFRRCVTYDLQVDTGSLGPDECADSILAVLGNRDKKSAFAGMAESE